MPWSTRLTTEEIGKAKALRAEHRSFRYITEYLGRSDHAIRNLLNPKKKASPTKKVGRPAKVTQRIARHVFRLATVKKYTSKRISKAADNVLGPSTVRKLLRSSRAAKWIKRKPAPAIKPHHKVARAAFAAKK
ncbi:hypothetical protein PC129_g2962 [Phytophthora cactorum]|uniref:Transposase IS30-like HTH domain-containing protein n=1 Tax=Phytophthora cactorum TaxID=29920 RepID=A0A329S4G7_9STRA|nr:hypothetical protein Pcac1_g19168 [Phytophthora cactorum]KAG2823841.1 hypothetical protein PC111_g10065 [Phytophthora cactorum]KAG2840391.1 hypothetical protein PC112_g3766 [Phytophthora cactorum]KAG2864202.1 hypothetical protein PC113_g4782 [Phytophthora cactorum]KAG2922499.1 hypothetical protein PC114_g5231 [Phytophthora cactorum]